jgi:hypothetical protein
MKKLILVVASYMLCLSSYAQVVGYEYHKVALVKNTIEQSLTVGSELVVDSNLANKSKSGGVQLPVPSTLPYPQNDKIKLEYFPKTQHTPLNKSASPAPTTSFQALGDNNAQIPPDTYGAASASYLMTTLNTEIRIQSKTGTVVSTQSLSSFWSSFTFTTIFDPRVHYDPYANRWIFVVCIDKNTASSSILIAVSATSNPTGTWYQWKIDADAGNTNWIDYPTVGFNKRWIVVSGNMFTNSGNAWAGPQIMVFDKNNLYSNGAGSFSSIYPGAGVGATFAPSAVYNNSLSNMFLIQDYNGNSGGFGFLSLSKLSGTTASPVLTLHYSFPSTSNTWNWSPGTGDFAPQSGSLQKIQNNDSKMQNVVYRNGSLWCTHHIFLPVTSSTHTAIQWWELDTLGTVSQRSRIEDVSGNNFYAFPSIAVNTNNDVLIGYSTFSSTQYASGAYSYRNHNDATNTMQSTQQYINGLASYYKTHSGTKNRWGDYSATVVDPVNDVDFWTIQEYAAPQSAGIDRWGTYWANVQCPLPTSPTTVTWSQPHCEGSAVTYTATPVSGASSYTWTIQTGAGWSGGSSTTNIANFTAGNVPAYIDVTANNACGTGSPYGFWTTPVPLPLSTFTVSNYTTNTGVPVVITGDETNVSASFNWNFSGGNASPGIGQGPHNVDWPTAGVKNVTLTTSLNGCSATQTTQAITVNLPSSINEVNKELLQIFPNPFEESFQIKFDGQLPELLIFDAVGNIIQQHFNVKNGFIIDMKGMASGIYFMRIKGMGEPVEYKLVKL